MYDYNQIVDALQALPEWRLSAWEIGFVKSVTRARNVAEANGRDWKPTLKQQIKLEEVATQRLPQFQLERVFGDGVCA